MNFLLKFWRWCWKPPPNRVTARWLEERRVAEMRNDFDGVCWDWDGLRKVLNKKE